jgi:EAL domain-containing protein (putative c-di-GMP-specific phosphodiesterase class I)
MTQDALVALLNTDHRAVQAAAAGPPLPEIGPQAILDGLRRDEFMVHFQPKVDAVTLRVLGVEALARWQHEGKQVRPDVFIRSAEHHGLIGALSEVLITKALAGGMRLADAGQPMMLAVNLSPSWLADVHLPDYIAAEIEKTGFKAENLILEVTETGVMTDLATYLDVLTRLRLKGFKLSIDDFGTGYSSMDKLQHIPFGELKLDRGYVQAAAERPTARTILASSIDIARKLHLSTVAEGVETQAQLDLVRGLGCDQVQGWLVAKAMPMDELLAWLSSRQHD